MRQDSKTRFTKTAGATIKATALAAALMALTACSSIQPQPLTHEQQAEINSADRTAARRDVEPITGPLSLHEAIARALKYNLDRRTKMMEEALALNQLDVTKFDMLPKLMAEAGYATRNNDHISQSRNSENGALSPSRFISQDRTHHMAELGFSWSLLDYGLGYYGSRQQADRVLIALEKRRKAMHLLIQDVIGAYWRTASAQKLRGDVEKTIALAEEALADARRVENERLRNPVDALRYQRQVLENLRLLESINQELASAHIELASLINAPIGQPIEIGGTDEKIVRDDILTVPLAHLEEAALTHNADLREQHYNARIAREETRKTLVRLFPNISFNYALKYDSDSYLVNRDWQAAGLQLSFNLFNLLTGSDQLKLAEAGVALADQRRMATQMAVLTQVHLARLQLLNARKQFERADAIYTIEGKISEHMHNREAAQSQSKLDLVASETAAILSLLRRYQALAQVQSAAGRLLANVGYEPKIGSTSELTLAQLTAQIRGHVSPWQELRQGWDVDVPAPAPQGGTTEQKAP